MTKYRCTRGALYTHNCAGREDKTARQGYYIEAPSVERALQAMYVAFPDDPPQSFTVDAV